MNHNNHEKNYFCISKRLMSLISAGLLLVFFFIFMTGYVWGKRVALEDVLRAVEQKTFADQISGSLYALSTSDAIKKEDSREDLMDNESVVLQVVENQPSELPEKEALKKEQADTVTIAIDTAITSSDPEIVVARRDEKSSDNVLGDYYAQLVGFGSKKSADQFVVRLSSSGLEGVVKERVSKGPHGKKRVWYQVVTQRYTNKEELERLVAHITKKEHLSGVQIIAC